jgi:hypothetical protein
LQNQHDQTKIGLLELERILPQLKRNSKNTIQVTF